MLRKSLVENVALTLDGESKRLDKGCEETGGDAEYDGALRIVHCAEDARRRRGREECAWGERAH